MNAVAGCGMPQNTAAWVEVEEIRVILTAKFYNFTQIDAISERIVQLETDRIIRINGPIYSVSRCGVAEACAVSGIGIEIPVVAIEPKLVSRILIYQADRKLAERGP